MGKPPPRDRAESPRCVPPASQWPPKAQNPRLFSRRASARFLPAPAGSLAISSLLPFSHPDRLRTPGASGLPNPLPCSIVSLLVAPPSCNSNPKCSERKVSLISVLPKGTTFYVIIYSVLLLAGYSSLRSTH